MASFLKEDETFVFGGGREMVGLERLHELLVPLQAVQNPCTLRLSNKSFSDEAASFLASVIIPFNSLQVADISDIIAGRPEEEALRTLTSICNSLSGKDLIELNVSDNALGSKGVESCRGVLTCKKLERLFLCNNGLSAESAELISKILHDGGCPPLKLLNFYNNMSGNGGAIAVSTIIRDCPNITNFRYSATRSGPVGCLALSQALLSLSLLTHLDLSDNTFDKSAAFALASAVRNQHHLIHLNLRDCGLGDEGTSAVLQALFPLLPKGEREQESSSSPLLELLDISGNDMSPDSIAVLSQTLVHLPLLRDLYMDDNELGTDGATVLSKALKSHSMLKLRLLSMETCEITAAGAIRVANAVSKIASFENIRLNGNQICALGVVAVTDILTAKGKTLGDMDDNDDDGDEDMDDVEVEDEVNIVEDDLDKLTEAIAKSTI